tara:strand:- start:71 stop:307 length:237 start_codon:yes stop_codon:yes gene_type:complete
VPKQREKRVNSNQIWGGKSPLLSANSQEQGDYWAYSKLNRDKQINYSKIWGEKGFRILKGEGTKGYSKVCVAVGSMCE